MTMGEPDSDNDVAGRGKSSWAQRVTAHVAHLQALLNRREEVTDLSPGDQKIAEKVKIHLAVARNAASCWNTPVSMVTGSRIDRAYSNVHKAEVKLLKLVPDDEAELKWVGTVVLAQARQHLGPNDPRLVALETRLGNSGQELGPDLKELAIATLLAAHEAEEVERAQARSFRNVLLAAVVATGVVAALFIIWNFKSNSAISSFLCFSPPSGQVCPTGGEASKVDALIVEGFGAGAAALAGSLAIRNIQGTNTPYSIPAMLVLLRLPVGALSALFGIVLINGQVVPGLSNLDSTAQIAAWAVIFGVAQESVTRMLDTQGNKVLGNMRGPERGIGSDDAKRRP
ncbi:hypothetical protein [Streptomyces sp. NPDC059378]|uniref:hypothetical protein n=1 Tax=Streptomyces sp. NPDC059378 TaxID=3346815 RepID=UPI0036BA806B